MKLLLQVIDEKTTLKKGIVIILLFLFYLYKNLLAKSPHCLNKNKFSYKTIN